MTPDGKYAAVEQSNGPKFDLLKSVVAGYEPDGSTNIGGQDWSRYQGDRYRGLTVTSGSATTLVTGSASYQELDQLAQALKA